MPESLDLEYIESLIGTCRRDTLVPETGGREWEPCNELLPVAKCWSCRYIAALSAEARSLRATVERQRDALAALHTPVKEEAIGSPYGHRGGMMFERFTDRNRRVIVLAQEEARCLNHNYVGTEHLLAGLAWEGEGVAAKVLSGFGVTHETVRTKIIETVGEGPTAVSGHIDYTNCAKKVIELALREALQLGHNFVGTEHTLLAIVREGEGVGAEILRNSGCEPGDVRRKVMETLAGYEAVPSPPTPRRDDPDLRRDERHKMADLLDEHADTLATFAIDRASLVKLIAFMLRLNG